MSDTTTVTVMVEDYVVREGAKDGKPWKKVGLKDANGEFYSTFDAGLGQRVIDLKGQRAEIVWKPSKNPSFKDLVSAKAVEDSPIAARAEDGTADWDLIGLRKTRCLLWAHFLSSAFAANNAENPIALAQLGVLMVSLAEHDIYHRDPAQPGDDIPF